MCEPDKKNHNFSDEMREETYFRKKDTCLSSNKVIFYIKSSLGNSLKMQQKNRPYKRIQQVGEKNVHFKIVQGNFPKKGHKVVSLLEMRFLTG